MDNISNRSDDETTDHAKKAMERALAHTEAAAKTAEKFWHDLQRIYGPHVPGLVLRPDPKRALAARARPGERAHLSFNLENRLGTHVAAVPHLTGFTGRDGEALLVHWQSAPPLALLAPGASQRMSVEFPLPSDSPPGRYTGWLFLLGFDDRAVQVVLEVAGPEATPAAPRAAPAPATGPRA
ncbi:MAG: hypothetical protein QOI63_1122 [Thermoplasmata archaeon]|jgi:hypothetical protein|nr:hypothetical protein [Thermoplasmata archaeon]